MTLFAINLVCLSKESLVGFSIAGQPAICTTLERAKEIVKTWDGDKVRYICIETVLTDVVQERKRRKKGYRQWWYEWKGSRNDGKYVPTQKPPANVCNHAYTVNMAIGI